MAEKRNRSNPPPPPPPASQKATTGTPKAQSSSLHNGHSETANCTTEKSSSKPKTGSKPFRITRAFSGGSIASFGKVGRGKRKSKIIESESPSDVGVKIGDESPVKERVSPSKDVGASKHGNLTPLDEKDSQQQPWKLPGIGTVPKLQQMKARGEGGGYSPSLMPKDSTVSKTSPRALRSSSASDSFLLAGSPQKTAQAGTPTLHDLSIGLASTDANNHLDPQSRKLPEIPDESDDESPSRVAPPSPIPAFKSSGCKKQSPLTQSKMYHPSNASASSGGGGVTVTGRHGHDSAPSSPSPPTGRGRRATPPTSILPSLDPDPNLVAQFRPLPPTPTLSEQEDEVEDDEVRNRACCPVPKSANQAIEDEYASIEDTAQSKLGSPTPGAVTDALPARDAEAEDWSGSDKQSFHTASGSHHSLSSCGIPTANSTPAHENTKTESRKAAKDYTIGEVVSTYAYALPVRVRILQGYCSDTTEVNISTDDVYTIHSVQHIKKVLAKDEDGITHRISLNAPLKIGLIYSSTGNDEEGLNGYSFKTISEVTSMPVLPKLIASTRTAAAGEEKNSVSDGEIFVVRHVNRSVFKGKKGLKVFSLMTRSNKMLFDDCHGNFSTKPSLVRLDLPDLLKYVSDIFPSSAVIYPTLTDHSSKSSPDFPGTLSRVVTLLECNTDSALVVSDVSHMDEAELEEANHAPIPMASPTSFDILLDDEIAALEVAVLKWTYPDEEKEAGPGGNERNNKRKHLYEDAMEIRAELGSNEEIHAATTDGFGSAGNLSLSQQDEQKTESNELELDHMYVNVQQKQQPEQQQLHKQQQQQQQQQQQEQQQQQPAAPAALRSDGWTEKEKKFFEEDADAGYDTVGIHLISSGHLPPAPPPPTLATSPLRSPPPTSDPSSATSSNNGYSVVHHLGSKMANEAVPFPDHGYSTVHMNRNQKPVIASSQNIAGYSQVGEKRTINGTVKEVSKTTSSDGDRGEKRKSSLFVGGGVAGSGVGGAEAAQMTVMMDTLEARLKSITASQQSIEINKMQTVLEMLTSKLEAVDSQLSTLTSSPRPPAVSGSAAVPSSSKQEGEGEDPETERNVAYLKTLNVEQVCMMMEGMGLGQYRAKIQEERLSGEILLECDDNILQEEVGITSRIHRIRLMKVITGQHSAQALVEKGREMVAE